MVGPFELCLTEAAEKQIQKIFDDPQKQGLQKQLKKAFSNLVHNPMHPGLRSHLMSVLEKQYGEKVYSSYVQNNTPQAHRILWAYGPGKQKITVLAVMPHY